MERALLKEFPQYSSRLPWLGPDLQTLRNVLRGPVLKTEEPLRRRVELSMQDGSGDRLVAWHLPAARNSPEKPLVLLVHGLGGSSESAYIRVTTVSLLGLGYDVLQLNLRGAGDSRPLCREQYHAGRTADLRDALSELDPEFSSSGIVVVGFSLGGNLVLKYAAEFGQVRGAVSISAPIDLEAASRCFLEPRNRLYHAYLLRGMKQETLATAGGLDESERDLISGLRSIFEFDDQIVAPRNGYRDALDYYDQNNSRQFLKEIEIPTLVMHALDDPWIPASMYTDAPWSGNARIEMLLSSGGGHVGFHGKGSKVPWHDRCLEVFLSNLSG